jgi:hypothetical protein
LRRNIDAYLLPFKLLWITLNDLANDTALELDITLCIDDGVGEIFEWCGELSFNCLWQWLSAANHLARVVPDISFSVDFPSCELLGVAFD